MMEKIIILLRYDEKKKSHNTLISVVFNMILFAILIVEAKNAIPKINTSSEFINYISFNIYQLFAIMLTAFAASSVSSIKDIRNFRYFLSYPISYKELLGFIKIRKFKNYILTLFVNLIIIFYIGLKFSQNLKFFIIFLFGFLVIAILCYLISDIISFLLYSIFPSNLFVSFTLLLLFSPILVLVNSIKTGNIIDFYDKNIHYLRVLDTVFPYCTFIKENLFSNPSSTYTILTILISMANITLLILLYEYLIKLMFFKVLEKEDGKKTNYSKINVDTIKIRNSFISSFRKEGKFLFRENKKTLFNGHLIIIAFFLIAVGIINRVYLNHTGKELDEIATFTTNIREHYILLALLIYIASLFIDFINLDLNSNRIRLNSNYFSFDKYLQLNPKNTIHSILFFRLIVSMCYYFIFLILLYLYNLTTQIGAWVFSICIVNIITVGLFDFIIDIKLPNFYSKKFFSNVVIDILKTIMIIIFKTLNLGFFWLIFMYLIHNIYIALLIGNLIFFIPIILIINSKYILSSYNKITYNQ